MKHVRVYVHFCNMAALYIVRHAVNLSATLPQASRSDKQFTFIHYTKYFNNKMGIHVIKMCARD